MSAQMGLLLARGLGLRSPQHHLLPLPDQGIDLVVGQIDVVVDLVVQSEQILGESSREVP